MPKFEVPLQEPDSVWIAQGSVSASTFYTTCRRELARSSHKVSPAPATQSGPPASSEEETSSYSHRTDFREPAEGCANLYQLVLKEDEAFLPFIVVVVDTMFPAEGSVNLLCHIHEDFLWHHCP